MAQLLLSGGITPGTKLGFPPGSCRWYFATHTNLLNTLTACFFFFGTPTPAGSSFTDTKDDITTGFVLRKDLEKLK